jgi:cytoskeletal protein CcmA (bactofilin family)
MSVFSKKNELALDPKLTTFISEGCMIEGKITGTGSIRIDGQLNGDIEMRESTIIGSKGIITGNIKTQEIVLFGTVTGNIIAKSVDIKSGGNILGDIVTDQMTVELGGIHNGTISMKAATTNQPLLEKNQTK